MPVSANLPQNPRLEWLHARPLLACIAMLWGVELLTGGTQLQLPLGSYTALHSLFELSALVLAALSFALLWMAPQRAPRAGTALLAIALAGAAALDTLHLLSYPGMPDFITPAGTEKSIAFWLAGRALLTLGLLGLAWLPPDARLGRRARALLLGACTLLVLAIAATVLFIPQLLPGTVVPGRGLTGFKVGAELILVSLLLLAAWRLQRRAAGQQDVAAAALAVAALLAAAGELCLVSEQGPSDLFILLSHVAKIGAYWWVTRAAYLLAMRQPLALAGGIAEALQATQNPALMCDERGTIRWANKAFERTTGRSAASVQGMPLDSLELPGDAAAWSSLRAALRAGRSWRGLVQAQRLNGERFICNRSVTPIHGPQGHLTGFILLGEDVTERERFAQQLQSSEERLRVLLEAAPDALLVIDPDGVVQLANPKVERLLGYPCDTLIGADIRPMLPPALARRHGDRLADFVQASFPRIIGRGRDVQVRGRDGRLRQVHLTLGQAKLPQGNVYIVFMRDIGARLQAEAKLAEREARYRALMDTALDGVWISDRAGRLLAVNDAYCRASGYPREELLRMRITDLEAAASASEVQAHIDRVMADGHTKFETQHRAKGGRIWPVELTISYWRWGGGQLFVFARDLSERQAAARALQLSEERFKLALRGTNDGLWDRDLLRDTLYLSPQWKAMLGYRDEELPNSRETFVRLLHPADTLAVQLTLSDIASGQGAERFELEMRLQHQQGHWVHVLSRGQLVRNAAGQPIRLVGTHQDLSERKRAEAALRASEDKLRNLFELSPLGIALCTLDGRLIEFNEAYRQLSGHPAEQLRRLSSWDLTPPEYLRAEATQLEIATRTGRYGPYEKEYLRADGSRVPVRLNGVRIEVDGLPHLWSIVEDLTESRQLETERQAMQRQQLQSQKLEALGQLTGGIAHDFNNMLAGIMGLASLGLERQLGPGDDKLARYLREILRTSERGRDLIAKMLAYVRTEEPTPAAPCALAPVVSEMAAMLKSSIPSTISLHTEIEAQLPAVRMPAIDMHQIIMNLVLNARDAVGPRGQIGLRLTGVNAQDEHCCGCHRPLEPGEYVVLEVSDDGPGVPDAIRAKIFDPFFTTKGLGKGTGLGLSSVLGLVHKAGGHMQVRKHLPQGTLMRVWLPAACPLDESALAVASAPPQQALAPALVWVVDDDPAVLVFLTELLREHGFPVRAFADAREALAALQAAHHASPGEPTPAALITDQTMPYLTGAELARQAMQLDPQLPVILCTGYSELVDADSAQALGVRHFLRKPFDSQDLLRALAQSVEVRIS